MPRKPSKRTLIREMSKFAANYLMTKEELDSIHIEVLYDKDIDCGVTVAFDDEEGNIEAFDISVNPKLCLTETLLTVAHEMVHVRQHVRNQLHSSSENFIWEGREYTNEETDNILIEDYMNLPWEKEAFELEEIIMEKFLEAKQLVI